MYIHACIISTLALLAGLRAGAPRGAQGLRGGVRGRAAALGLLPGGLFAAIGSYR